MLLVVDFTDLDLNYGDTDISIDSSADFTVGKLLKKLCEGIEEIGGMTIPDKPLLKLLSPKRNVLDATHKVKDLALNDWDRIYIVRRF